MSIFRRRPRIRSEKLARQRRKMLVFRFFAVTFSVIFLVGLSSWLLHRPAVMLTDVVVQGNRVVTDEEILSVVDKTLSGAYFFIFPRRSSLIYPERGLTERIPKELPRIKSVDLVRVDPHTLSVEVHEQQPFALWCKEGGEGLRVCYFINGDGFVYAPAPNFTGNVFFHFFGGVRSEDPIGEYTWGDDFGRLNLLIDSIEDLGMEPVSLMPEGVEDFALVMENGSRVLFGQEQRSSEVIDNLKAVLGSETFNGVSGEDVDYIDLRFGNKVYFKLR